MKKKGVGAVAQALLGCDQSHRSGINQPSEILQTCFGLSDRRHQPESLNAHSPGRFCHRHGGLGAERSRSNENTPLTSINPLKAAISCPPSAPPLSLVLGDHHHHAHPEQQSQDLHHRLAEAGAARQQLRQHRHRGDVDEAAGGEGQDPGGRRRAHALCQQRANRPAHGPERRQQLEENGLMGNRKRVT